MSDGDSRGDGGGCGRFEVEATVEKAVAMVTVSVAAVTTHMCMIGNGCHS